MIERLKDLPADVDGFRARGKVTREDYEHAVRPVLDEARSRGRRLRFLYHFGPEFESVTPGAAWEDARLGLQYLRVFERCAIVSDVGWIREASRLASVLMPCPVKVFGNGQWQEALGWLTAAAGRLAHRWIPERGVLIVEPHGPLGARGFRRAGPFGRSVDRSARDPSRSRGTCARVPGLAESGQLLSAPALRSRPSPEDPSRRAVHGRPAGLAGAETGGAFRDGGDPALQLRRARSRRRLGG